jgi:hypothetical protein
MVVREGAMSPFRVWLSWVAANVIPSFVVSALLVAIVDALGVNRSVVVAYVVLFALVAGLQARVWRRWLGAASAGGPTWRRWAGWTLVALVVAMFFGVGIVATLDGLGHEHLGLIAGWAVAGAVVGAVQAATLGVSRTWVGWWIAASVSGWIIPAIIYSTAASTLSDVGRSAGVRWLLGGLAVDGNIELAITGMTLAVYGMLTGVVLARVAARRMAAAP